jgi:hypothetical protein
VAGVAVDPHPFRPGQDGPCGNQRQLGGYIPSPSFVSDHPGAERQLASDGYGLDVLDREFGRDRQVSGKEKTTTNHVVERRCRPSAMSHARAALELARAGAAAKEAAFVGHGEVDETETAMCEADATVACPDGGLHEPQNTTVLGSVASLDGVNPSVFYFAHRRLRR